MQCPCGGKAEYNNSLGYNKCNGCGRVYVREEKKKSGGLMKFAKKK